MTTCRRAPIIKRAGLTMIEVVIAALVLGLFTVEWFRVLSQANRQSMDTYYEFLAIQLAGEPIEVFRALGYNTLEQICQNKVSIPEYPLGTSDISTDPSSDIQSPGESALFRREILLSPAVEGVAEGMKVSVRVYPREDEGRLITWWRRREVKLEAVIWKLPR